MSSTVDTGSNVGCLISQPDLCNHIHARWLGFCTEAVTDIDNFVVEYSDMAEVSVQDKAMILAATFLIDLMYYEESG